MPSVLSAIQATVPITSFNRGQAGRIFEEVRRTGAKVVMKNNTAECVLLSPAEYTRIMEELEDAELYAVAMERLAHYDPKDVVTEEEMREKYHITQEDLDSVGEVEFE